jgi:hypothetical protein
MRDYGRPDLHDAVDADSASVALAWLALEVLLEVHFFVL